jgi:hypothetical protein
LDGGASMLEDRAVVLCVTYSPDGRNMPAVPRSIPLKSWKLEVANAY